MRTKKPIRKLRTGEAIKPTDLVTATENVSSPRDKEVDGLVRVYELNYHLNKIVNNDDIDQGFWYYRPL